MKKYFFVTITNCSLSICLLAQNDFKGQVIDRITNEPLEAAVVEIREINKVILTDKLGNFEVNDSIKRLNLVITSVGYTTRTIEMENEMLAIISMERGGINLSEVTLVAAGGPNSIFKTISKIDLNLRPVKNSQELLRLIPGLFVAQHAGGGKAEQIFLRGFDADHGTDVQITVDGLPVNMVSHAHGQGYADSHFIIPETVNKVDFGTGPYYASHGNFNTAGYVSFSTFNSIERSRLQFEAGRFNTLRTLAIIDLLKKNKTNQNAYVAGEFNYTDGPTIHKQNFKRINLFGKYNLAITGKTKLSFSASAFKSKWDASGQVPERAVANGLIDRFGSIDPSEGGNTERYNANLIVNHSFHSGLNWETQAYFSRYKFNLYSNFTFFLNDPVNGDAINQKETRNVFGYLSKLVSKKNNGNWSVTETYAAGIRYDATKNSTLAHVVKRRFLENIKLDDINEANAFTFIEKQFRNKKWNIVAAARADYFINNYYDKLSSNLSAAQRKLIVSPKLNIQYSIHKAWQLYLKAGKGFHSNDTRVVTACNRKETLPAAYGTDLGVILKPTKKLLLNVAGWYLYLQQEFVYVGDEAVIEPSGRSARMGIDITGRYQFTNNLFASININLTRARSMEAKKGENYIPLAPSATSVGGLFYKAGQGFNGGLSYRFIKNRPANEDNSTMAKGYFLLDGTINYSTQKFETGVVVENILNTKWNEAQFNIASRLIEEAHPVSELHFTPGLPFFVKLKVAIFF